MLRVVVSALLAAVLLPNVSAAQAPLDDRRLRAWLQSDRGRAWMNTHHDAARLYRAGDASAALDLIAEHTLAEQRLVAGLVLVSIRHSPRDDALDVRALLRWDHSLVHALAAIHMELALQVYVTQRATATNEIGVHFQLADMLFHFIERPQNSPHWKLAIGLTAFAEGQLGWAAFILDQACRTHPAHGPLLLACGSVHEAIAIQPADRLLASTGRSSEDGVAALSGRYNTARNARRLHLTTARQYLETLSQTDTIRLEGQLRLAHVRLRLGQQEHARLMLEEVATSAAGDRRIGYLAPLLLGRVRQQQGDLDGAVDAFEAAIGADGSGQSAYVALAHVTHQRGDAAASAAIIRRMLSAAGERDDPWLTYRFGQYWVPKPLLGILREEACR